MIYEVLDEEVKDGNEKGDGIYGLLIRARTPAEWAENKEEIENSFSTDDEAEYTKDPIIINGVKIN